MEDAPFDLSEYFETHEVCSKCGQLKLRMIHDIKLSDTNWTVTVNFDWGKLCGKCDADILRKRVARSKKELASLFGKEELIKDD